MADISTWSPTDESNTAAPPAGWPENMQPSAVNNSARGMMGAIRRWYDTVTAQLASITTSLGNYLPLGGGTLTGPLSAPLYYINGISFASGDGTTTSIYDPAGSGLPAIQLQNTTNYYDANAHIFRNDAGSLNAITFDGTNGNATFVGGVTAVYVASTGNIQAAGTFTGGAVSVSGNITTTTGALTGAYIHSTGAIEVDGGIHTTLDVTGRDLVATRNIWASSGAVTAAGLTSTGNIQATSTVTGGYVHSTGNIQADADLSGNRLFAGTISASGNITGANLLTAGDVYGGQLRNAAGDAGVLRGLGPTPHALAFGWQSTSSILFFNVDGGSALYTPWSAQIEHFDLAADGGAPSGWRLGIISGGTVYNIYVDYTASDERLKRNIADSEVDALAALCAVRVRRFEWRDEVQPTFGVPQAPVAIGLVAQDLLPTMSDCVGISEGREAPFPADTYTIMHDRFDAYFVRAIQQLEAQNAELEARIVALEK